MQNINTLYDVARDNVVQRRFFGAGGFPQGEVPMDLINLGLKIFYSGAGFDLGAAPQFSYPVTVPSYLFDTFYGMFAVAFHDVLHHTDWTLYERAESVYDQYVHNYMYWYPMRDERDLFDTGIRSFGDLESQVAIKFYAFAEIVRALQCTLRGSITEAQMDLYAEMALNSAAVEMYRVGYDISSL